MKTIGFFWVLILTVGMGVNAQEYNQYDAAGRRHGQWQKVFKGTNILRYQGTFDHGKEVGLFKFFKPVKGKAVLTATREFNTTTASAKVTFYDPYGMVVSEGEMNGKTYIGAWKYYQRNSQQLLIAEHYNTTGVLHGERIVYYKNGQIAEQNYYKDGVLDGEALWYAKNGALIKKYMYVMGKLHGKAQFYDSSGHLKTEGAYKADKKHGTWTYYDQGKIVETKKF